MSESAFSTAAKNRMTSPRRTQKLRIGPTSPGVGAYNIPSSFAKAAAAGRPIGSISKKKTPTFVSPSKSNVGPGSHDSKDPLKPTIGSGGSKYSLGSRRKTRTNKNPGPGKYTVKDPTCLPLAEAGPKFSFGGKTSAPASSVPGPGEYEAAQGGFGGKSHGRTIGGRATKAFNNFPLMNTPGPGAHDPKNVFKPTVGAQGTKNVYILSSRREAGASKVPGPGKYEAPDTFRRQRQAGHAVGGKAKKDIKFVNKSTFVPGPGAHEPMSPLKPTMGKGGKKFSFVDKRIPGNNTVAPGPGRYEAADTLKRAKQPGRPVGGLAARTSKNIIAPNVRISAVPGPGTHEVKSKAVEGPKYSMSPRRHDPSYYLPG